MQGSFLRQTFFFFFGFICVVLLNGCVTTDKKKSVSSRQDVEASIEAVVEAVSGQDISPDEMQKLKKQIRKDPQTRQSIQTISEVYTGSHIIKFCPVDGRRYSSSIINCPDHEVELEILKP